jgi:hypothetical protein
VTSTHPKSSRMEAGRQRRKVLFFPEFAFDTPRAPLASFAGERSVDRLQPRSLGKR